MDAVEDFLLRMQLATLDGESWLYLIPMGYSALGSNVEYGPWRAATCAVVLTGVPGSSIAVP